MCPSAESFENGSVLRVFIIVVAVIVKELQLGGRGMWAFLPRLLLSLCGDWSKLSTPLALKTSSKDWI